MSYLTLISSPPFSYPGLSSGGTVRLLPNLQEAVFLRIQPTPKLLLFTVASCIFLSCIRGRKLWGHLLARLACPTVPRPLLFGFRLCNLC